MAVDPTSANFGGAHALPSALALLNFVGEGADHVYGAMLANSISIQTHFRSRENGGDDGTRTRDLCRDRRVFNR